MLFSAGQEIVIKFSTEETSSIVTVSTLLPAFDSFSLLVSDCLQEAFWFRPYHWDGAGVFAVLFGRFFEKESHHGVHLPYLMCVDRPPGSTIGGSTVHIC